MRHVWSDWPRSLATAARTRLAEVATRVEAQTAAAGRGVAEPAALAALRTLKMDLKLHARMQVCDRTPLLEPLCYPLLEVLAVPGLLASRSIRSRSSAAQDVKMPMPIVKVRVPDIGLDSIIHRGYVQDKHVYMCSVCIYSCKPAHKYYLPLPCAMFN